MHVANAPLSYGAFEVTVGRFPNVPGPEELLARIAAAGYEGTELGPPGYLGDERGLPEALARHGLRLSGGFAPIRFSEPEHWNEDFAGLQRSLDLFAASGHAGVRAVLADAGSPAREANPGGGASDRSLGLDEAGWTRLADGVKRAEECVREAGCVPTFHHHTATHVEAPWEIERFLELTTVDVLIDTGHLLVGGGDPVAALREWGDRVNYVHIKDVRLEVLATAVEERLDMIEAWRRGIFCELGAGDVDFEAFFAALRDVGYDGWLVVEQDRILREDESIEEASAAQERNRAFLRDHGI
jgi:inosose dehydratase